MQHAVTRSVRDSAALLDATGGPATGDAYFAPPPARPFLDEVGRQSERLKIAFHTIAHHDVQIHPECVKAVEDTAKLCEQLGHIVEEAKPDIDGDLGKETSHVVWAVNLAKTTTATCAALGKEMDGSGLEWITWEIVQRGKTIPALDYVRAVQTTHRLGRQIAPFFERYDVVLSPVLSRAAWPLGTYEKSYGDAWSYFDTVMDHSPFCWPYNMSGQPAMSVPLHWTGEGLPVGVQFAGRYGDEATLFRLAAQLEEACPWIHRRPPILDGSNLFTPGPSTAH